MSIIEHGTVSNGAIALDRPLSLPEGSKARVQVEVESPTSANPPTPELTADAFASLQFFGRWADRQDMADSAEYVRKEREKWQQRPYRKD
jgi:hypothetical protein